MTMKPKPLIEQRADPFVLKHSDGYYYFTASVPEYDRLELRRSETLQGLATAEPTTVWRKPDEGPYSDLIWAPEIHFNAGAWYVYFAAAPSREIKDGLFQHRMYAISCQSDNPLTGNWGAVTQIETDLDSFCLDATTFEHEGELYYLWAQKDPKIDGNSNLYLAKMDTPTKLAGHSSRLSIPEYSWERIGFSVNEGPAVVRKGDRIFVTYSASATDENYCMGLLWADAKADLLDSASWTKSKKPVFQSAPHNGIYGPGHNSFTRSEDGEHDVMVYHARTYPDIKGDPLWDPNRHTFTKRLVWDDQGWPVFGEPGA